MPRLTDSKGQPTTLRAGNGIGFHQESQCLVLMENPGDGRMIQWPGGDDKRLVYFIKNEGDFANVARLVAATHGLSCRKITSLPIPAYVFED